MSAERRRKETTVNKRDLGVRFAGILLALGLYASPSAAETATAVSAPAFSGVKEIIVDSVHMSLTANGTGCALARGEVDTALLKMLKNAGLPVFSPVDAKPPMLGVGRIDLIPEIVSISSQGTECASWVALSAQTHSTVRVPPIETPRNVVVAYWQGGLLIDSSATNQPRAIMEALEKLSVQLAQQYRLDQPPPLPDFGDDDAGGKK
jgi:hypothetical protein